MGVSHLSILFRRNRRKTLKFCRKTWNLVQHIICFDHNPFSPSSVFSCPCCARNSIAVHTLLIYFHLLICQTVLFPFPVPCAIRQTTLRCYNMFYVLEKTDPQISSKLQNGISDPKGLENKVYADEGQGDFFRDHTVPITSCS